jgi:guanylate kinase
MTNREPVLLIVSSPSGAGKTTLCKRLLSEFSDIRFSISHTTRTPRSSEQDGRDYRFVSLDRFHRMVAENQFAEWANVHGNHYGTSHQEIQNAISTGTDLIFDVDYQGAASIQARYPDAVSVFILPPSIAELKNRLQTRGTESPESLHNRFTAALGEIEQYPKFTYLLVNENVDQAYDQMRSILLAERCKNRRMATMASDLLDHQEQETC